MLRNATVSTVSRRALIFFSEIILRLLIPGQALGSYLHTAPNSHCRKRTSTPRRRTPHNRRSKCPHSRQNNCHYNLSNSYPHTTQHRSTYTSPSNYYTS